MNKECLIRARDWFAQIPTEKIHMEVWRDGVPADTLEEFLGHCGYTACFAGAITLWPEAQAFGITVGVNNAPELDVPLYEEENVSIKAIAMLFDIPYVVVDVLCCGEYTDDHPRLTELWNNLYNCKPVKEITKADVLTALAIIIDGGAHCD